MQVKDHGQRLDAPKPPGRWELDYPD